MIGRIAFTFVFAVMLLAAMPARAQSIYGTFQGGGDACLGVLNITKRSLVWNLPSMSCSSRYAMGSRDVAKGGTFALTQKSSNCPLRTVIIERQENLPKGVSVWNVRGLDAKGVQRVYCAMLRL